MNYTFPIITHINQVLGAINVLPNFSIRRDEARGFTTIDYVYVTKDLFSRDKPDWEILRECRGIAFCNETGKVISRPFNKFFNYGELPETSWKFIKKLDNFTIEPKLDGSMIRAIPVGDSYVLATRAGVTAHALEAAKYVTPLIDTFIKCCVALGMTPMFEFIGPANPNVLFYDKNELRLLAVRDNRTGVYTPKLLGDTDTNVAKSFLLEDIDKIKLEKGEIEGYVLVTQDGQHRLKVKTDDYVMRHRAKDRSATERAVLEVFFSGNWDDFYSMLPESPRKEYLSAYIEGVQCCVDRAYATIKFILSYSGPNKLSKKEFAIHINNDEYTKGASPILFSMYDKPEQNIYELLKEYGLSRSSNNNGVERMRWLVGNGNFKEEKEDNDSDE